LIALDRPRHKKLINDVREAGARIRLTLTAICQQASQPPCGHKHTRPIGIGGAPEGVITAAAMKCLNGEIQAGSSLILNLGVDKSKIPEREEVLARLKEMASRS